MIEEAQRRMLALRKGDWKYIAPLGAKPGEKRTELYNLKDDPGEASNVIGQFPEKASEMAEKLQELIDAGRMRN